MRQILRQILIIFVITFVGLALPCSHDDFAHKQPKKYYDDKNDKRLLQTASNGK